MNQLVKGHIIFDHDGTLVSADSTGLHLFPGMLELIENLITENYLVYVWTARPRNSTKNSLKTNNIIQFITDFYCADDGMNKPHPMGLFKMLEGIDKKKIIHIGDSMSDLEGAKNFGIDFIFAGWNDKSLARSYKEVTPFVAETLNECKKIIDLKFN